MSTPQQLKERWETPVGKKVRQQIIDHIKENNWERFLEGFPFVEEIKNKKDLRYAVIKNAHLYKANLIEADLTGADLN